MQIICETMQVLQNLSRKSKIKTLILFVAYILKWKVLLTRLQLTFSKQFVSKVRDLKKDIEVLRRIFMVI